MTATDEISARLLMTMLRIDSWRKLANCLQALKVISERACLLAHDHLKSSLNGCTQGGHYIEPTLLPVTCSLHYFRFIFNHRLWFVFFLSHCVIECHVLS